MKQGEIWYVDLNPVKGSEQAGYRPVVIVSGNLMNSHLNIVICCPLTTQVKNYKGNVVLEPNLTNNLDKISEVITFHIRSISKERMVKKVGAIKPTELSLIRKCLDEILNY